MNFVYFLDKVNAQAPQLPTVEEAKKQILDKFLSQQMRLVSSGSISRNELENYLLSWNSTNEGSIASAISNELSQRMNNFSTVLTGAGFKTKFQEEVSKEGTSTVSDNEKALSLYKMVQQQLQLYLDVSKDSENDAAKALIKELAAASSINNVANVPAFLSQLNVKDGMAFSKASLKGAETKFVSLMKELGNIIQGIASIAGGGQNTSYLKTGTKRYATIDELASAVAASFSAIGGEYIYEPLAVASANAVKKKMTDELKETNTRLSGKGCTVTAHWVPTGESASGGYQGKDDMFFIVSNDSVTLRLGGSLKLRQGKGVKADGSYARGLNPQENFNLGQFIDIATNNTGKDFYEQYWSLYLTSASHGRYIKNNTKQYLAPAIASWNQMKQVGKYTAALRVLTGSGVKGDFSSIFIVNNQIVSMYALLNKLVDNDKNKASAGIWISGKGYTSTFASHSASYRTSRFKKDYEAEPAFYSMLDQIYKKRINIQVNMLRALSA